MKKILVVLTGGTIGSKIEENVIDISSTSPYRLLSFYRENYGEENFEVIQPVNVLSENMTPDIWITLFRAIEQINYDDYDGIIVTHGSDTLSYTAAFMGMLFYHLPIPVVLVASNYPLGQSGSNGLINFANAVAFIREKITKGVFVIYQDNNAINQVYLATRIREAEPYADQFDDFGKVSFGRMEMGCFVANNDKVLPTVNEIEEKCEKKLEIPERFSKDILVIRPYPGMNYSMFDLSKKPAAILHYLYHSATACADTKVEDYGLLSFVEKCKGLGIDIYTASHKDTKGKQYASGEALLKTQMMPLSNLSVEAAYAKLMLCYHQKTGVAYDKIYEDIFFENVNAKNV